jgi:proline dehydrogenase
MPNRLLLRLASHEGIRHLVTTASVTRPVVERFVAGEALQDALIAARALNGEGMGAILDYLGEHVSTESQADDAAAAYLASLKAIAAMKVDADVSVKLTQLGLDQSFEGALARLRTIGAAGSGKRTRVAIDMEEHSYVDRTIEAYRTLRAELDNLVLCLQAYLRRTEADVASLVPLRPSIRLVKGAYNEPKEIALSRWATAGAYRRLLGVLLPSSPSTAVATHDELLVREATRLARRKRIPRDRFEFQMLYGVRRDLQRELVKQGYRVRVYIPFGGQWYPYLMRRLAERPANLRLFLEALARG